MSNLDILELYIYLRMAELNLTHHCIVLLCAYFFPSLLSFYLSLSIETHPCVPFSPEKPSLKIEQDKKRAEIEQDKNSDFSFCGFSNFQRQEDGNRLISSEVKVPLPQFQKRLLSE